MYKSEGDAMPEVSQRTWTRILIGGILVIAAAIALSLVF